MSFARAHRERSFTTTTHVTKLFLLIALSIPLALSGQIIANQTGSVFEDENFFNPQFIKQNKIKVITGKLSTKKELETIIERGLIVQYHFDTTGRLIRYLQSFYTGGSKIDTSVVEYFYEKGNLISKRQNDNYGYYTYTYTYNENGKLVEETYSRETNLLPRKDTFVLAERYIITTNNYAYENPGEGKQKRKLLNSYGRAYQEEVFTTDKNGFLTEIEVLLIVSNKRARTTFKYNERGDVTEKLDTRDLSSSNKSQWWTFKYDKLGNLLEEDIYRNDKHIYHREVLYDEKTMLLKALITKDMEANYISILKYGYVFY